MQELKTFDFENHQVRTLTINSEPYFVGKDVANILGYSNSRKALKDHVDDEDKNTVTIRDGITRGNPNQVVINESGLYSLIMSSKLPTAKKFKRWVTSEVLPAIRKHGAYMTDQKAFEVTNKDGLADLLEQAANQLKDKDIQIEKMKPKVQFADAVAASNKTILVGDLAKILKGNGLEIGANRLFRVLRKHGYLIKRNATDYNMPTQFSMKRNLFQIKETVVNHADGHTTLSKTPKVTGKGQEYFVNLFMKNPELLEA
jgi:anti-repressor protein